MNQQKGVIPRKYFTFEEMYILILYRKTYWYLKLSTLSKALHWLNMAGRDAT